MVEYGGLLSMGSYRVEQDWSDLAAAAESQSSSNLIGTDSKAMVFPVVMYGCESWTVKKLTTEKLMLLNCGVGVDTGESLGLQVDPDSLS